MYQNSMSPRYIIAFSMNSATAVMAIVAATALRFMLANLNKKLDRGEYVPGVVVGGTAKGNGGGQAKGFRFLL